MILVSKTIK